MWFGYGIRWPWPSVVPGTAVDGRVADECGLLDWTPTPRVLVVQPGNGSSDQGAADGLDRSFVERARRAQIVQATIDTVADEGLSRASFTRIAKRAGISPSLISYHFASREDLVDEVVATVVAGLDEASSLRAEGAESYHDALRAVIEGQVHHIATHQREILALGEILRSGRDADGRTRYAASRETSIAEVVAFFAAGQADGEFRTFDTRAGAVALLAALEAVPVELAARPDTDVDAFARELGQFFDRATRVPHRPGVDR